jgi:hypothetical protein
MEWLATFDRRTDSMSTHAARDCGYGDMLRCGYVVNRGTDEIPDLYITTEGKRALMIHGIAIRPEPLCVFVPHE